ncbi:MAG: conjugal transfer protein TraF [Methylophilaceae bacterium]|nr:conjugal transfer protein TraF [Methylophilaceae bacterium]
MNRRFFAKWVIFCLALCFLGALNAHAQGDGFSAPEKTLGGDSWWNGSPWTPPDRGFNWYPPDAPSKKPLKKAEPQKSIKEMETMEALQKEINRLKDVAVMKPTEANVRNFLEAQAFVMDKGSFFADVARRVAWQTPSVDYNNRSPTANYALLEKNDMLKSAQYQAIANLGKDYGLLFFFKSDCTYCHSQAPILKLLENSYGLPIMAVSLDGGTLPQFPNAKRDNGISMMVTAGQGVDVTPTMYLINRATKQSTMIGSGALAMDEIVERIRVLTTTKPGQEF